MAIIKYVGGLSRVRAPWMPNPEVLRGASVECPDEDAAKLLDEPGSPWARVEDVPPPASEVTLPSDPGATPEPVEGE